LYVQFFSCSLAICRSLVVRSMNLIDETTVEEH
jgi:hypothetical protein